MQIVAVRGTDFKVKSYRRLSADHSGDEMRRVFSGQSRLI